MVDELMREFAVGAAILGNLSAVYLYAYAGLQIPVGICIDKFGLKGLVAGACAVCGIGCIVFSYAESVSFAYLGRALIGAGAQLLQHSRQHAASAAPPAVSCFFDPSSGP